MNLIEDNRSVSLIRNASLIEGNKDNCDEQVSLMEDNNKNGLGCSFRGGY